VIRLTDITKSHFRGDTEVQALRGVSVEIERGSFNFIVGPSGSGKSSLLYLLGALDLPTEGTIEVEGRELISMNPTQRDSYRRDEVGFVFQSFNLLGNLSAVDNVLVPYLPQGISEDQRKQARDLLTQFGLAERLDHRPNHLSGGEQQRIAIARALLKKPKVILADEPTGELDSKTGAAVFDLLRKICAEQETTIVVVTHDESFLTPDDRVIRMRDGKIEHDNAAAANV
jgi:putative ABC transport system ATP-binding protein